MRHHTLGQRLLLLDHRLPMALTDSVHYVQK